MSGWLAVKVMHTAKKLFCNVVSICNLVAEFNGLVSIKGPAKVGPFTFIARCNFYSVDVKKELQKFFNVQVKIFFIISEISVRK